MAFLGLAPLWKGFIGTVGRFGVEWLGFLDWCTFELECLGLPVGPLARDNVLKIAAGGGVQELFAAQDGGKETRVVTRLADECGSKYFGGKRASVLVWRNVVDGLVEVDQFSGEVAAAVVTGDTDENLGALAVRDDVILDHAGRSLSDLTGFAGTQKKMVVLGLRSHGK